MTKPQTTRGRRRHPSSRIAMLAVRVCLSGCMMPAAMHSGAQQAAPFTFERYEVVTGVGERQTILTGFLVGGSVADLAVVHIDENDDRRLRIFTFTDRDWAPEVGTTLRPEASFVDVANIDGGDRLVIYGGGRLTWFDPETGTERELAAVTSDFSPPPRGEVLHVDITRDLNGDGRDDLVVPHGHGFQVLVQMSGGTFADPVTIGPSTGLDRVYGADGYRYRPWDEGGRIHEMSDKPSATRRIKGRAPGVSGEKGIVHPSVLIGDVNGDSRLDLLVQKGREELRVFLGVPGPDLFARRPEEVAVAMPTEEYTWLVDLNKDGKQDILMHHTLTTEPHRVTMLIAR